MLNLGFRHGKISHNNHINNNNKRLSWKERAGPLALDLNLLPLCQAQMAMEDTLNLGVAMKRSPEALGQ